MITAPDTLVASAWTMPTSGFIWPWTQSTQEVREYLVRILTHGRPGPHSGRKPSLKLFMAKLIYGANLPQYSPVVCVSEKFFEPPRQFAP